MAERHKLGLHFLSFLAQGKLTMKAKHLLAAAVSVVLLAACGKQSTDTAQTDQASAPSSVAQDGEEKILNFYNYNL